MATLNSTCEQGNSFVPIVPNNSSGRVCGTAFPPSNSSRLASCCGTNNPIQQYQCTEYCNTELNSQDFVECLAEGVEDVDIDSILGQLPFCQEGIRGNVTERLSNGTSGSGSSKTMSSASLRTILWIAMFSLFLTVSGAIVPSLSSESLSKRQEPSEACTINMTRNYTTIGRSKTVSSQFFCGTEPFCTFGLPINTGILNNNRTINGSSAAEPIYDSFFDNLQNVTSRMFPALSSAEFQYGVVVRGSANFYVAFTPTIWCAELMTDCKGIGGEGEGMKAVEACGPTFVSDYIEGSESVDDEELVIQGDLSAVITD